MFKRTLRLVLSHSFLYTDPGLWSSYPQSKALLILSSSLIHNPPSPPYPQVSLGAKTKNPLSTPPCFLQCPFLPHRGFGNCLGSQAPAEHIPPHPHQHSGHQ